MLVLLLVAVFPLIYMILVSFQGITMMDNSSDFVGLVNYHAIFKDQRLWEAVMHTLIFLAIALPLELFIGLLMAQLFEQTAGPANHDRPVGTARGGVTRGSWRHLVFDV